MTTVAPDIIIKMWCGAIAQIKANVDILGKLDSVMGDGDHGISMLRVTKAVEETFEANPEADLETLFSEVSMAVMMADAGSTSPLMGAFFDGFSEVATKEEYTVPDVTALFVSALESLTAVGRAKPGDKTSLDVWIPAIEALKAADPEAGLAAAFRHASTVADAAADATKGMQARCGRARNYGEKSIGHLDPGAVSTSYLFKGFSKALNG